MEDSSCSRNTLKSSVTAPVNAVRLTLCGAAAGAGGAIPLLAVELHLQLLQHLPFCQDCNLNHKKDIFFSKIPGMVNVRII